MTGTAHVFEQLGRCRLEWGRQGARRAAARGDALVVVDTLSFSTAVATAVDRGATIYPCAPEEDAGALARAMGAELAVRRRQVPAKGRFSLSPLTFLPVEAGTRVVVASPNGATCCRYGAVPPLLVVGALVNAAAVAAVVSRRLAGSEQNVTVLCAGERWHDLDEEGQLRVAVEDYLEAGAILAALSYPRSPEAQVCVAAFEGTCAKLHDMVWECASGRELRAAGFGEDVRYAAQLDLMNSVPIWQDGALQRRDETRT